VLQELEFRDDEYHCIMTKLATKEEAMQKLSRGLVKYALIWRRHEDESKTVRFSHENTTAFESKTVRFSHDRQEFESVLDSWLEHDWNGNFDPFFVMEDPDFDVIIDRALHTLAGIYQHS